MLKFRLLYPLLVLLLLAIGAPASRAQIAGQACTVPQQVLNNPATGNFTCTPTSGSVCPCVWVTGTGGNTGGSSGVVGGTFGGNPGSYTFTSAAITTAPFTGNLMLAGITNPSCTGTFSAGSNWTFVSSASYGCVGVEYQLAGSALSYSGGMSNTTSQTWSGTITVFQNSGTPAFVQGNVQHSGTNTCAYSSNNGAGNLLFLIIDEAGLETSVTDTRGNTWILAGLRAPEAATQGVGNGDFQEVWYALNSKAGANTVTATPNNAALSCTEFSGVSTTLAPVDYNYNADSTGNTATTTPAGATTNTQYIYTAVNNVTGNIDYGGPTNIGGVNARDHASVFRAAAANIASTGGQLYHKKGIYVGQTSLQEVNDGLTGWYVFALPPSASAGNTQVVWDLIGETGWFNGISNKNGTIFQALPSAWSGVEPTNGAISVIWQRPAPSAYNNSVFFRNMACRLPTNQVSNEYCFDSSASVYSYHVNLTADTAIPYGNTSCSGLTPGVSNAVGFRSNVSSTNETYFENTWAIGWNTPYQILSNHPFGINMHTYCNANGGVIHISTNTYGGEFHHYQELHDIIGLQLTCDFAGTRLDFFNTLREVIPSGGGAFSVTGGVTETNPGNCEGVFDITTGSNNGVAFAVPPVFASGGTKFQINESGRQFKQGLITSNFTSAATTQTTKQTLATFTFPYTAIVGASGGIFNNNAGAVIRIKAWGITAANTNSKTFEIDFGGTAIATITTATSAANVNCQADIIVSSVASTQEVIGVCSDGTAAPSSLRTAPGITGTANIVLNVAATTGTATGDLTFKGLTIELLGGS